MYINLMEQSVLLNYDSEISETKKRIIESATTLIWQSSYDAVGINEICKKASVTKGAFYHYFKSKADLFYEASLCYLEGIKADLEKQNQGAVSIEDKVDSLINLVIDRQIEAGKKGDCQVGGCPFFTAAAHNGVKDQKIIQSGRNITEFAIGYVKALLDEAKKEGFVAAQADSAQTARMIYHYIQGLLMYGRIYDDLEIVRRDLKSGVFSLMGFQNT